MNNSTIARIEYGSLTGRRPRHAGANARLNAHGDTIRVSLARLTNSDGAQGFGACWLNTERAATLIGQPLATLFSASEGVSKAGRAIEFPLWDLIGKIEGKAVWQLAAGVNGKAPETLSAPCYDTSLYFDDLHLSCDDEAAAFIAAEALEGKARGHVNFKLKVGRGARHMEVEAGTRRDIKIVRAVRQAVGEGKILIDANNGYNLNLTKRVLNETADCEIFWLEEAFHEDAELYRELKKWMNAREMKTLIADGEGDASPHLLNWAKDGLIDVIQYDIAGHGFTTWLHLGRQLDEWNGRSAPHHYGGHFGNYSACHLAGAIDNFTFAEWDECATPGLDGSAYKIENGRVSVPSAPGWGLHLDEEFFQSAVAENGFIV